MDTQCIGARSSFENLVYLEEGIRQQGLYESGLRRKDLGILKDTPNEAYLQNISR